MKIKVIGFTTHYNSKADRRFTNGQRHSVKPIIVDIRKRDTSAPSIFDGTSYECRQKIKELNLKLIASRGRVYWDNGNVIWEDLK